MSDQTDQNDDTKSDEKRVLKARPGRLELKKTVDAGQVRQSFSHGRTKSVAVEVRRKRTFTKGSGGSMKEVQAPVEAPPAPTVLRTLTEEEAAARARALKTAQTKESGTASVLERAQAGAEARRAAQREEEEQRAAEEARRREEDERRRQDEEERKREEEEATKRAAEQADRLQDRLAAPWRGSRRRRRRGSGQAQPQRRPPPRDAPRRSAAPVRQADDCPGPRR